MQAPAEGVNAPEPKISITFAGFLPRFIAYIIDSVFIGLVSLIIGMSIGILADLDNLAILGVTNLAAAFVGPVYLIAFWATQGATPGKIFLGMRIVASNGRANGIGWGRAILRYVGYVISMWLFYLGFIWIVIDDDNQGWHDKIAKTYVVNV